MAEYQEKLKRVRALLKQGNVQEALRAFHPILRYPGMVQQSRELSEALEVFADISDQVGADELTTVTRHTAHHLKDPDALYNLGYEMLDQGLADMAATILAEAHRLAPDKVEILTELCAALERSMLYGEASRFLKEAPELVQRFFLCSYLLAFNSLMSGDLATARRLLPELRRLESQDEHFPTLAGRIESILLRGAALKEHTPLDGRDLRGWHMVITAGLLLHMSPYGFDEGMNGRYAFVQDTPELCIEGIYKVKGVLDALHIAIPRIFALPERSSTILAEACARVLKCPLEAWPDGGSDAPGLIVAYDLSLLNETILRTLIEHRPGQILWSHASCWVEDLPIAADLTTFLYQVNYEPWGERLEVDAEQKQTTTLPSDERDASVIGKEIASAELTPGCLDDVPLLIDLVRAAASVKGEDAPGLFCGEGRRQKQWSGSPVSSSRFA